MKAVAVFQFYLPYVLPRAPDWPGATIGFQFPDFLAVVRPRDSEEELFPHEIDKTLSTMTLSLTRVSLPTSGVSLRIRDRSHDRVEVRVEGQLASSEDARRGDIQERFLETAIRACNEFLNHCRVVGRAPFVTGVEAHYRLEDGRHYALTPYSVSWFNGEDGQPLPAYHGEVNACASSGAAQSPERGSVSMALIRQSLQAGDGPSLSQSLLVDAEAHLRTQRLREAVLALGTAFEVASEEYLQRSRRSHDPEIKRILAQSNTSFAQKRLHLVPIVLCGQSLGREDPASFELVENTYRTRNSLAHEGRLRFKAGRSWVAVDLPLVDQFLVATDRAIAWLEAL